MSKALAIGLIVLALAVLVISSSWAAGDEMAFEPGRVIVKLRSDATPGQRATIMEDLGVTEDKPLGLIAAEVWELQNYSVEDAVSLYSAHSAVVYIEPDYIRYADAVPNDPRFPEMWAMRNTGQTGGTPGADIDAVPAWDVFTGDSTAIVGVIDTGTDYNHPDLAANIWTNPGEIPGDGLDNDGNGFIDDIHGWDFCNNDNNPMDDNGHGTHTAGTIGAVGNNAIGVAGVCWTVEIMPLKFLDSGGSGTTSAAILCVEYATMMGVHLTSNSWGGGGFSQGLYDAIEAAGQAGILFVASAGNAGSDNDAYPRYPSSYDLDNIIAVASTDHNDSLAGSSCYGLTSVDLGAPGVSILSTLPGGSYGLGSGTSMACPHVSGVAALIRAALVGGGGAEIKSLIISSVDPIPALAGRCVTGGRLNVFTCISGLDSIPPDPVTDLVASNPGSNTMDLDWTATGDDGSVGTAGYYDIRYSTAPITAANFDSAAVVTGIPAPEPAGTLQSMRVTGLDFNTFYYFAMMVFDKIENSSPMSNVTSGTTLGIPYIEVSPDSLFEELLTGAISSQTLTVSNIGDGTLDFITDPAQWLTVIPSTGRVPSGSSLDLDVNYDATGLTDGYHEVTINIGSNDPDEPEVLVPVELHVIGAPDILVTPDSVDFGQIYVGMVKDVDILVSNPGTDTLNVTGIVSDTAEFTALPTPFNLAPGQGQIVTTTFSPASAGMYSGNLTISSDDPDEPTTTVTLTGLGVTPPDMIVSPDSLEEDLFTGQTSVQVLTISNTGGADLEWELNIEEPATAWQNSGQEPSTPSAVPYGEDGVPGWQPLGPDDYDYRNVMDADRAVLIITSGGAVTEVKTLLEAYPDISVVDLFEASGATPTLDSLLNYDAAIIVVNSPLASPVGMGDVLADYVDAGGGVIMTLASFMGGWEVQGRFLSEGYHPFTIGSGPIPSSNLGAFDPAHPIMESVTTLWGDFLGSTSLAVGSEWVADWVNGEPCIATKGENIVGINVFPIDGGFWSGDVPLILHNAVFWSSEGIDWLSASETSGTVPSGTSVDIDMTFDAADLHGGDYYADVVIESNDPDDSLVTVPAHLDVTGAPHMVTSSDSLDYGEQFIGASIPQTLVVSNQGTDSLSVTDIVSDHGDYAADVTLFDLAPGERQDVTVTFSPSTTGSITGTLAISSNDPDEPIVQVMLTGVGLVPPDVWVSPDSLSDSLYTEETSLHHLVIGNDGGSDLTFEVKIGSVEALSGLASEVLSGLSQTGEIEVDGLTMGAFTEAEVSEFRSRLQSYYQQVEDLSVGSNLNIPRVAVVGGGTYDILYYLLADSSLAGRYEFVDVGGYSDYTMIEGYDGLVVCEWDHSIDNSEALSLRSFYDSGKPVILGMDDLDDNFYYYPGTDSLLMPVFGISDVNDEAYSWGSLNPDNPVTEGISQVYDGFEDGDNDWYVQGGADWIFAGTDGYPYGISYEGQSRTVVMGEFLASIWSAGNGQLIANAIDWMMVGVGWLSVSPESGTVPSDSTLGLDVTFDATGLFGGDYYAGIVVSSNDPDESEVVVPAHLRVTGVPDISASPDSLDYGRVFIGASVADSLVISNVGTDSLFITDITFDDIDYSVDTTSFKLYPNESQVVLVTFSPTRAESILATLTVTSNDPDEGTVEISLVGEGLVPPDIWVSPDSLSDSLYTGETSLHHLVIGNDGGSDLEWSASIGSLTGASVLYTLTAVEGEFEYFDGASEPEGLWKQESPLEAVLGDLTSVDIIWDASHGQSDFTGWSIIISDLILRGATVTLNHGEITASLLSGYDILWTVDLSYSWSGSEITALVDWVHGGGGLVLEGDNTSTVGIYNSLLAPLGAGIEYSTTDGADGITTNIYPHETTAGIDSIYLYANVAHLSVVTSPASVLIEDRLGVANTAYSQVGSGRVIAMADEVLSNGRMGYMDNQLFGNQVMEWLAGAAWLVLDPVSGVVPAGDSDTVDVTFDATGLYGGDYYASIVVSSNDPDESLVEVPAHLNVTGVADISISADSLDYGRVFIGVSVADSLEISNVGTDSLFITDITVDDTDYSVDTTSFKLYPNESQVVLVTFSPTRAESILATLTVASNDPDEGTVEISLVGEGLVPPDIWVSPDSLSDSLYTNETSVQILTIGNTGGSDLEFDISLGGLGARLASPGQPPLLTQPDDSAWSHDPPPGYEPAWTESSTERFGQNDRPVLIIQDAAPWGSYANEAILQLNGIDYDMINSPEIETVDFDDYAVVLIPSDQPTSFYQTVASFPDRFADYVAAGGVLEFHAAGWGWNGGDASLVTLPGGVGITPDFWSVNYVLDPSHPIVAGVPNPFYGSDASHAYLSDLPVDALLIAEDGGGNKNLIEYTYGMGTVIASGQTLEFGYDRGQDAGIILFNMIPYAYESGHINWLSVEPSSGTVPAGSSVDVAVTFDATGLFGGDYYADIVVLSNDPDESEVVVPAHLNVTGIPDIVAAPDSLDYGMVYLGYSADLGLEIRNEGTDTLRVSDIVAGIADYSADMTTFAVAPAEAQSVTVTFSPLVLGDRSSVLTILSDDPDSSAYEVVLTGLGLVPPDIWVSPDSLSDSLYTGETSLHHLVIGNDGGSDLEWSASIGSLTGASVLYTLTAVEGEFEYFDGASEPEGLWKQESPLEAVLGDLTSVDIIWDASHGQSDFTGWSIIISDLILRGATVTLNHGEITASLLSGYDILWTVDLSYSWSGSEITALVDWVHGGGGLVLEGDNTSTVGIYNSLLAPLGAGIEYSTTDGADGITTNIYPHETTAGVDSIYLYANVAHLSVVTSPASVLIEDRLGVANTAYSQVGSGRVIAMADEVLSNGRMGYMDNQLFGNQVMEWLAGAAWLVLDPVSGVVPAGDSDTVDVTFDATGLYGGDYYASIVVSSNDPDESLVEVAAHLNVTGVPDIAVEPDSLDFGDVFVGYSGELTLGVANNGTDTLVVTDIVPGLADYMVDTTSFELAPGAERLLAVTFGPSVAGDRGSILTIHSNDLDSGAYEVVLAGTGLIAPDIWASPDSLSDSLYTGETSLHQLVIGNDGGSDLEWSVSITSLTDASVPYTLTSVEGEFESFDGAGEPEGVWRRESPLEAMLTDLTGVDILWDASHGQGGFASWSIVMSDLILRGATVTLNHGEITASLLGGYDMLWTVDLSYSWSGSEITALVDWVHRGGGLVLEGDDTSTVGIYNSLLTALGAGIEYSTTSGASGITTNIYPHETTAGIDSIYVEGNIAHLSVVTSPASVLIEDRLGVANTAYSQVGSGRVIAMADEVLGNWCMGYMDNQLFGNQVVDWLAGPGWLALDPVSGVVPAGDSMDVNVLFDATDLSGGNYQAAVIVESNDPDEGRVEIPASLHVTVAPYIVARPETLYYGEVFLGLSADEQIEIANQGMDTLVVTGITAGLPDYVPETTSLSLGPGEAHDVTVAFTPQAEGDRSSLLTIMSNDPRMPSLEIPLVGFGLIPPDLTVSPPLFSDTLFVGYAREHMLILGNTGGSDLEWTAGVGMFVEPPAVYTLTPAEGVDEYFDGASEPEGLWRWESPLEAVLSDLTGVDILWDASHGQDDSLNWSVIISDLILRGATVTMNHGEITASLLGGYDILWTVDLSYSWSGSEITALVDWVNGGGSLVLEGDNTSSVSIYNSLLASLGAGIEYSGINATPGITTNIYPHETTGGVDSIYLDANIAHLSAVTSPASVLIEDVLGVANTAYSEVGSGRVIAMADEVLSNGRMGYADNQLFGNQAMDWLAQPRWLALEPVSGVVPAGAIDTVNVTFDATELFVGDYYASILVSSNDPDDPEVTVPCSLCVLLAPEIDVSTTALDFGPVNIGDEDTLGLIVYNHGPGVLQVTSLETQDAQFSTDLAPFAIDPGDSTSLDIVFTPTVEGPVEDTLTIHCSDPEQPTVAVELIGTGVIPCVSSWLGDVMTEGGVILVPVMVSDVTGEGVYSSEVVVSYDPDILSPTGYDTTGTLVGEAGWFGGWAEIAPGQSKVSMAGIAAIEGEGALVTFTFAVADDAPCKGCTALEMELLLNEGEPCVENTGGGHYCLPTKTVSGTVRYYGCPALGNSNPGMPGVDIFAYRKRTSPDSLVEVSMTNSAGGYTYRGCADTCYTLRLQEGPPDTVGISSLDASLVIQYTLGQDPLGTCPISPMLMADSTWCPEDTVYAQQVAADATGDGTISAFDAYKILSHVVGLDGDHCGEWVFYCDRRHYCPLDQDHENQDYVGVLIGDVSGSWHPDGGIGPGEPAGHELLVSDVAGVADEVVSMPVYLDIGEDVLSLQFRLLHDAEILAIESVGVTGLASGWQMAHNALPGETRIALAGAEPIGESGEILLIQYRVCSEPGVAGCSLEPVDIVADEGRVFVEGIAGAFSLETSSVGDDVSANVFLSEINPNPASRHVEVGLNLPVPSEVEISVYDATGRLVRRLMTGEVLASGRTGVRWNGRSAEGGPVSPGVYFVSVKMGTYSETHRLVVVE